MVARSAMLIALVALAVSTRELRLAAFRQHQRGQHYEDVYYLPSAKWLPLLSLGYQSAWASVLWCKSLVYFGEDISHKGVVKHVFEYTDAILALDSDYLPAYRWIATAAIYRPTEVSFEDGYRAANYLRRAVKRWPKNGELQWEFGSLLRFELAPIAKDAMIKRRLLEEAAPHLETAARLGAGPPWLALNNAELLNKLGRTEQAIRHLEDLRSTVQDDVVRKDIEHQLERLRARSYLEAIRETNEQFERSWKQDYPYLPEGLFFWVGARQEGETDVLAASDGETNAAGELEESHERPQ